MTSHQNLYAQHNFMFWHKISPDIEGKRYPLIIWHRLIWNTFRPNCSKINVQMEAKFQMRCDWKLVIQTAHLRMRNVGQRCGGGGNLRHKRFRWYNSVRFPVSWELGRVSHRGEGGGGRRRRKRLPVSFSSPTPPPTQKFLRSPQFSRSRKSKTLVKRKRLLRRLVGVAHGCILIIRRGQPLRPHPIPGKGLVPFVFSHPKFTPHTACAQALRFVFHRARGKYWGELWSDARLFWLAPVPRARCSQNQAESR